MPNPPPGMSQQDFNKAIGRLQDVVGKDWVFTSDEHVATYKDAYSPLWGEEEERVASAAVAPVTVEQVQGIVEVANEYKLPLFPFSTGKNLTYGGSAPAYSGSVMVDLKRMNRILDVNERDQTCLVEPGVSYFDMYRYLRQNKIKLWIDCPDPGWGSLIGNALDHGGGYTGVDFRDHFDAHCGMEVVLANGALVRTGMGANEKSKIWQLFKHSMGPSVDGLFAQSNFGIVTKMGFWLMEEPQQSKMVTINAFKRQDIMLLLEIVNSLMTSQVVSSQVSVFSPASFGFGPEQSALIMSEETTDEDWNRLAAATGQPYWSCSFAIYGVPGIVAASWEHIKDRFSSISGVQFVEGEVHNFPLSDADMESITDKPRHGVPSLSYFSSRQGPGLPPSEGHMDFATIIAPRGEELLEYSKVLGRNYLEAGLPPPTIFVQMYHARVMTMFQVIPIYRDVEKNRASRVLFSRLLQLCSDHGWTVYRTHTAFQDEAMGTYNFNNNALLRLNETLKDALDPNGILSAGRYGIWPKHLRETRG